MGIENVFPYAGTSIQLLNALVIQTDVVKRFIVSAFVSNVCKTSSSYEQYNVFLEYKLPSFSEICCVATAVLQIMSQNSLEFMYHFIFHSTTAVHSHIGLDPVASALSYSLKCTAYSTQHIFAICSPPPFMHAFPLLDCRQDCHEK